MRRHYIRILPGRPREDRAVALRPRPRPDHLPLQVRPAGATLRRTACSYPRYEANPASLATVALRPRASAGGLGARSSSSAGTIPTRHGQLPRHELPGARPRDRLRGPRGQRAQPVPDPARRQDRRLHRPAGQSGRRADPVLRGSVRRRAPGAAVDPAPGQKRSTRRTHRLLAQSPPFDVGQLLRVRAHLRARQADRGRAKDIVALTVPTWAPAFAVGLQRDTGGARRGERNCANVDQQAPMTKLRRSRCSAARTSRRGCTTRPPTCRTRADRTHQPLDESR